MLFKIIIVAALCSCAFAQCYGPPTFRKIAGDFTYEGAKYECRSRGGYIAVLTVPSQIAELDALAPTSGWFFIGATNLVTQGTWIWDDGRPATFFAWSSGQPDNYKVFDPNGEHCLMIGISAPPSWNDVSCMWPKTRTSGTPPAGVVCEFYSGC